VVNSESKVGVSRGYRENNLPVVRDGGFTNIRSSPDDREANEPGPTKVGNEITKVGVREAGETGAYGISNWIAYPETADFNNYI